MMGWNMKELRSLVEGEPRRLFDADSLAFKAGANRAWNPNRRDMDKEALAYCKRSRPYEAYNQEAVDAYLEGWLWALEQC